MLRNVEIVKKSIQYFGIYVVAPEECLELLPADLALHQYCLGRLVGYLPEVVGEVRVP